MGIAKKQYPAARVLTTMRRYNEVKLQRHFRPSTANKFIYSIE